MISIRPPGFGLFTAANPWNYDTWQTYCTVRLFLSIIVSIIIFRTLILLLRQIVALLSSKAHRLFYDCVYHQALSNSVQISLGQNSTGYLALRKLATSLLPTSRLDSGLIVILPMANILSVRNSWVHFFN